MNFLLFGPPGAGKGTQSELLVSQLGVKHISTGDILREAIKAGTSLGIQAKSYMDSGALVPDALVVQLIEQIIEGLGKQNFLLDGFPRTIPQAEALDGMLSRRKVTLDKAIFLDVDHTALIRRLAGRRMCSGCNATYHLEMAPPKKEGVCDRCGSSLFQRPDDKSDVIGNRLLQYEKNTAPVKEFYKKQGKFISVDGMGEPSQVFDRLLKILRS